MSTDLVVRRLDAAALHALSIPEPADAVWLTDEHRRSLALRFRDTKTIRRRRLEAWDVEGLPSESPFHWSPRRARRALGRAALARFREGRATDLRSAVRDEVDELCVRAAAGYANPGSLAQWIAAQPAPVVAAAVAQGTSWATTALVTLEPVAGEWRVCDADAFYDVAGARTSLRGCRDVVIERAGARTLLRLRSGQPGPRAGSGLRADLVVDGLCDRDGRLARRVVGLWPDAGVALALDGTIEHARRGAHAFVRAANAAKSEARLVA